MQNEMFSKSAKAVQKITDTSIASMASNQNISVTHDNIHDISISEVLVK